MAWDSGVWSDQWANPTAEVTPARCRHKPLRDNGLAVANEHLCKAYVLHPRDSAGLSVTRGGRSRSETPKAMSATLGWYREGGPIMLLILLVGVAGLAILLERLYVIVVRSKNNGRVFIERIIRLVRAGKIEDAIKDCAASAAALSDMGLLILRSRSRDEADLHNVANAASLAVVPKLTHRLHYLPTFAAAAVLLGLLGTTLEARNALAAEGSTASVITAQLGRALTPTTFGLGVAIVLILGRGYLVDQSESITEQIQEFSARLVNALIDRPDVRLGHR
jgi:biopolymer transport protein ExbB